MKVGGTGQKNRKKRVSEWGAKERGKGWVSEESEKS